MPAHLSRIAEDWRKGGNKIDQDPDFDMFAGDGSKAKAGQKGGKGGKMTRYNQAGKGGKGQSKGKDDNEQLAEPSAYWNDLA